MLARLAHRHHGAVVAVEEDAALRRPGRARRVDERVRVLGLHGRRALGHLVVRAPAAALTQLVERDRAVGRAVEHDDRLEIRQPVAHLGDLGGLLGVLGEQEARLGVARHPLALLGRVGGVDRDDDAGGAADAEAGVRPLRPGGAQDRSAVALRQAEIDQPAGDLGHDLADLAVSHVDPFVAALEAHRGVVGIPLRGKTHQVGDRRRARRRRRGRAGFHSALLLQGT